MILLLIGLFAGAFGMLAAHVIAIDGGNMARASSPWQSETVPFSQDEWASGEDTTVRVLEVPVQPLVLLSRAQIVVFCTSFLVIGAALAVLAGVIWGN